MNSRRRFFVTAITGAALAAVCRAAADDPVPRAIGLGFSLYGMKTLSLADGLKTCAEIGYDCVELPVMPDWPADSAKLSAGARRELRGRLADHHLRLTSLMENLPALGDETQHAANLQRLKRACELAGDLKAGGPPPLVETVLGGRPGEFEAVKERLAARLKDWAKVADEARVTLAIKAHVGNAVQRPQQLVWLLEQVASHYLKAVYDYSHFQLQGLAMAETMQTLLPFSVFVHVKDAEQRDGKSAFLLPGDGPADYAEYFKLLAASKYRGDALVEVSGQVSSQPGYEPEAAARKCYNHLAAALAKTGIRPR